MHRHAVALFVLSIILISGCVSGNTIKRQAAEPSDNLSLQAVADYGEDVPEEQDCSCPDSVRACPEGFSATCENECSNGTCERCMPDCTGHGRCNETWFCGEWAACSGGAQSRRCVDSSFCNRTARLEARTCPDSCSSDSDCPRGSGCSAYICRGSPKACEKVMMVPCCGDGTCDASESCPEDCLSQRAACDANQCPQCPSCNETTQQNETQNTTSHSSNVSITNITYKAPEFVEIWNLGDGSADMTNWTLADNSSHIYVFPAFLLQAGAQVSVHTESGTNNITDLFWGKTYIWNDKDGDVATLKDSNGNAISVYSYSP